MSGGAPIGRLLGRLAGADAVRPGRAADRVAGRAAGWVVRPRSADDLAAVLAAADERGWGVVPRGGGTRMAWGAPPTRCDVVLETGGLDQILEHVPGDHVAVVGAGASLALLAGRLRASGGPPQRLMLDPPGGEGTTVGGVAAAAAAGPRRHRHGTPRDLVLGARFVLADGTTARSGGKVVKNVAGYDLAKLLVGSRGTLAVLVELSLKLHPEPEAAVTVVVDGTAPGDLAGLAPAVRRQPVELAAAEFLWPERRVALRVEGSPEVAAAEAGAVARAVAGRALAPAAAKRLWEAVGRRPWDGPGAIVAVALPADRVGALVEMVGPLAIRATLTVGLGTGTVRLPDEPSHLERLRERTEALGGTCRPLRVDPARSALAASRPDPAVLRLMAELRHQFDPRATLSPGRLGWGLP